MDTVEAKFLNLLYEKTADAYPYFQMWEELGKELGLTQDETRAVVLSLQDDGLVEYVEYRGPFPHAVRITCLGRKQVRSARLKQQEIAQVDQEKDGGDMYGIHPVIKEKCSDLYKNKTYAEAVEKSFKVVRDRLRDLTNYETGQHAFGRGKLYIRGASAPYVDADFNEAVKFLTMAIDHFRNEKSHTSDANIEDQTRAYQYLILSSLAMGLLENAEIRV